VETLFQGADYLVSIAWLVFQVLEQDIFEVSSLERPPVSRSRRGWKGSVSWMSADYVLTSEKQE